MILACELNQQLFMGLDNFGVGVVFVNLCSCIYLPYLSITHYLGLSRFEKELFAVLMTKPHFKKFTRVVFGAFEHESNRT